MTDLHECIKMKHMYKMYIANCNVLWKWGLFNFGVVVLKRLVKAVDLQEASLMNLQITVVLNQTTRKKDI